MKRKNLFSLISTFLVFLMMPIYSSATIREKGTGLFFCEQSAFQIQACNNWVLDNESGIGQGVPMILYPKGETWKDSPVVIYGKSASKEQAPSIEKQIDNTLKIFHNEYKSPNYKAEKKESIKLQNGKIAEIYYFSGDRFGNYEAGGYIEEDESINFLIMSARNEKAFKSSIIGFYEIVSSYENKFPKPTEKSEWEKLSLEADKMEKEEYSSLALQKIAPLFAEGMNKCSKWSTKGEKANVFDIIVHIAPSGSISKIDHKTPTAMSVCFSEFIKQTRYPSHSYNPEFLQKIEMKIK